MRASTPRELYGASDINAVRPATTRSTSLFRSRCGERVHRRQICFGGRLSVASNLATKDPASRNLRRTRQELRLLTNHDPLCQTPPLVAPTSAAFSPAGNRRCCFRPSRPAFRQIRSRVVECQLGNHRADAVRSRLRYRQRSPLDQLGVGDQGQHANQVTPPDSLRIGFSTSHS